VKYAASGALGIGHCKLIPTKVNERTTPVSAWDAQENPAGQNMKGMGVYDACATSCAPEFDRVNGGYPEVLHCSKACLQQYHFKAGSLGGSGTLATVAHLVQCKMQKQVTLYRCDNGKDVRDETCRQGTFLGTSTKSVACSKFTQEATKYNYGPLYGRTGPNFSYKGLTGCEAAGTHPEIRAVLRCAAPTSGGTVPTAKEARGCAANLCAALAATY